MTFKKKKKKKKKKILYKNKASHFMLIVCLADVHMKSKAIGSCRKINKRSILECDLLHFHP